MLEDTKILIIGCIIYDLRINIVSNPFLIVSTSQKQCAFSWNIIMYQRKAWQRFASRSNLLKTAGCIHLKQFFSPFWFHHNAIQVKQPNQVCLDFVEMAWFQLQLRTGVHSFL